MTPRGSRRGDAALLAVLSALAASAVSTALIWADGFPEYGAMTPLIFASSGLLLYSAFVMGRRWALNDASVPSHAAGAASATSIQEAVDLALTRREEARLLFESVDEGIVIIDPDLAIAAANPAAQRLLSPKRAHAGTQWRDAIALLNARGGALVGSADPFARAVASGRKAEASAHLRAADGAVIPIHVMVLPVESALDGSRRYLAVLRDRSTAQRQMRAVADLVAEIVHDLRTPLTALQGFAELLMENAVSTEERRDWVTLIHTESLRLGRIIDDILDVTRLQLGKARVQCADVELAPLIENVLAPFRAAQTHAIELDTQSAPLAVHADGAKVARALTNLVANAVKYSPLGSVVRVRVFHDDPRGLAFEVSDRGPGVPAEDQERILEPFFRGSQWEADSGGDISGSGLGLAIVRSIARLHDGDVVTRNHSEGGAVFTLTIGEPARCQHRPAAVANP